MAAKASKEFTAGDVILECFPIVYCIDSQMKSIICDFCLKRTADLKHCSKCHQMYYCNRECQQNDWPLHKSECKVFRNDNFKIELSSTPERLLLRLWLCAKTYPEFS